MFSPRLNGGLHQSLAWLVGKSQVELGVYICLVGGIGFTDHLREVGERGDDGRDVVSAHLAAAGRGADLSLGGYLLGLGLGDPRADHGGVSARVQTRAVAADLGIVVGDARAGGFGPGCRSSAWLTGRAADR